MKKVTAAQIAEACGVSQATVSYVINNTPNKSIRPETRAMILETARRLDYVPNSAARSMRTQRAQSIGVVIGNNVLNFSVSHLLRGIKQVLDGHGWTITLLNYDSSPFQGEDSPAPECAAAASEGETEVEQYLRHYRSNRIDALAFLFMDLSPAALEQLDRQEIPYLSVSETGITGKNLSIDTHVDEAIRQCALFCREQRFSRLLYLTKTSPSFSNALPMKTSLFMSAIQELCPGVQVSHRTLNIRQEDSQIVGELSAILEEEDPQLIFTTTPKLGFVTQTAILSRCFSLPQQIKHISLSSSPFFDLGYPTVTHLDIPFVQMGRFTASHLLRQLEGEAVPEEPFVCRLKTGQSTMTAAAGGK